MVNDFSQPWSDKGVAGLWKNSVRDEAKFQRLVELRTENLRLCNEWRQAAEADGWQFTPTYQHEPVEHAFRGNREGFSIQGIARPNGPGKTPEASIHIWGPDGLAIKPPLCYNMDKIRAGARRCGYCSAEDVDTVRVGFAGRCCLTCEPTIRPHIETPGWNS
jgi:hypothetical protein